jgi:hypothetical protein
MASEPHLPSKTTDVGLDKGKTVTSEREFQAQRWDPVSRESFNNRIDDLRLEDGGADPERFSLYSHRRSLAPSDSDALVVADFERAAILRKDTLAEIERRQSNGGSVQPRPVPLHFVFKDEDAVAIIRRLQAPAEASLKRSYVGIHPVKNVLERAPVIRARLCFLSCSNVSWLASIDRAPAIGGSTRADQMTALWRVNTTGHLLSRPSLRRDMDIEFEDMSEKIAERAKKRIAAEALVTPSPAHSGVKWLKRKPHSDDSKALTIDSGQVEITHNLGDQSQPECFDLESTIVEVDGASLITLILRLRITKDRDFKVLTKELILGILQLIFEDVRRLFVRSPILLRASTRKKIIESKDVRYGTNSARQFVPLIHSKGIMEVLSWFSAIYLASAGATEEGFRRDYRSSSLQTLVLLTSLLNDEELAEIREFLEKTFSFKAGRHDFEILLLKVLPLESLSPKTFMASVMSAVRGESLDEAQPWDSSRLSREWDSFLITEQERGFILPWWGLRADGAPSWTVEWPSQGFQDSMAFGHLQYSNPQWPGTNQVPRIDLLDKGGSTSEVAVLLSNWKKYVVLQSDYERIIRAVPDIYTVQDSSNHESSWDSSKLVIAQTWLNQLTRDAVNELNFIINAANQAITVAPKQSRSYFSAGRLWSRSRQTHLESITHMNDCTWSGRIVRNVARLDHESLAESYQLDGQTIPRDAALKAMKQDLNEVKAVEKYYGTLVETDPCPLDPNTADLTRSALSRVRDLIQSTEQVVEDISHLPELDSTPILAVLRQVGNNGDALPWYEYETMVTADGVLNVTAYSEVVSMVRWHGGKICEIELENWKKHRFYISPLRELESEEMQPEIEAGDVAILMGHYVMIATRPVEGNDMVVRCESYMKISFVEKHGSMSRRDYRDHVRSLVRKVTVVV